MKSRLTDNLILKILSVLMAILIWIVVLSINDPSKTRLISGIKVAVENESVITDNNQVYTITEGQLISVKVTGPRTIVDSLKADDFTATADFKDLSQANSVPIDVQLNEYAYQQKVTINEKSNNTIRLDIEDLVEETYEIQVKYVGIAADNYVVADTQLDRENVKITAPQSVHESIKEVCANVNIVGVSEDFETTVPIKVYNNKGVELIQADNHVTTDIAQVNASSTVYYTKSIPVSYTEITSPENTAVVSDIRLSKNNISIMGKKEYLDRIEEIVLPVSDIIIGGTQEEITRTFDIEALLPENVYLNDTAKTITLTVVLEGIAEKTIYVDVKDIGIKNIPDGMDASISSTGSVSIRVEGKKTLIDELKDSDIVAYVSLKNLEEGVSSVPVTLQLAEGLTQISDGYVSVKLTDKSVQEDTTTVQNPSQSQSSTAPTGQTSANTQTTTGQAGTTRMTETSREDESETISQKPEETTTQPASDETEET